MRRSITLSIMAALLASTPSLADVINVPDDYPTIQEGIDAASSGDIVLVAEGEYLEEITLKSGVIVQGAGGKKAIQGRIEQIRNEIEITTSDYDREKLQERLAKLAGGVAQINVGAASEVEMKEIKARVEDALHATRAAIEEGIVPGGGVALLRCRDRVYCSSRWVGKT